MLPLPTVRNAAFAVAVVMAGHTYAEPLKDYRCKIERVATSEPLPNAQIERQTKTYVGKEFTVERKTGLMAGALKNSYITRPEVIDFGSDDNSYKVVTTLRKEQGVGRGSNTYLLVVSEYKRRPAKPFLFVDNDEVYFGTCNHF